MAPTKDPIATLKRKRADIKARLTKYKNFLATVQDSPDVDRIQVKAEALEEHLKKITLCTTICWS